MFEKKWLSILFLTLSLLVIMLPNAFAISVSPASHDFGNVKVGTSSAPQTFTIYNIGTGDLHISGMTLWDTTNYSLNINGGTNPCGSTTPTVTPNSSCTVTVTFSPTSTGALLDSNLVISSDDTDTPTLNISLSGRGTIPKCGCDFFPETTVIPKGRTLGFLATVTNHTTGTWIFYFATKVTTPDGSWYPRSGYLLGPIRVTLTYYESKSKYISLFIPKNAPLGTYTYHGYLGIPGAIWDECKFNFTVTE